jgi:hypothetical protein
VKRISLGVEFGGAQTHEGCIDVGETAHELALDAS